MRHYYGLSLTLCRLLADISLCAAARSSAVHVVSTCERVAESDLESWSAYVGGRSGDQPTSEHHQPSRCQCPLPRCTESEAAGGLLQGIGPSLLTQCARSLIRSSRLQDLLAVPRSTMVSLLSTARQAHGQSISASTRCPSKGYSYILVRTLVPLTKASGVPRRPGSSCSITRSPRRSSTKVSFPGLIHVCEAYIGNLQGLFRACKRFTTTQTLRSSSLSQP